MERRRRGQHDIITYENESYLQRSAKRRLMGSIVSAMHHAQGILSSRMTKVKNCQGVGSLIRRLGLSPR